MSEKETFWICGRRLVLPPTPDPIDFSWEKGKKKKKTSRKGKKAQGPVTPTKKRYRLRKKQK